VFEQETLDVEIQQLTSPHENYHFFDDITATTENQDQLQQKSEILFQKHFCPQQYERAFPLK